jgi:hypothetical protein
MICACVKAQGVHKVFYAFENHIELANLCEQNIRVKDVVNF